MRRYPTDPAQMARWLRTPRTGQSPAEYANPLDFPAHRKSEWSWIDYVTLAMAAFVGIGIWKGWL